MSMDFTAILNRHWKKWNNESEFLMWDFNAKVGNIPEKSAVGPHGLGSRNDREDKLVD